MLGQSMCSIPYKPVKVKFVRARLDAPEEMVMPTHIAEQAIHGGELATYFRLAGDAVGTPLVDGEGDLELRMRGSTAGEQGGGDAGGSNVENRLLGGAQVAVEGAVKKGLPPAPCKKKWRSGDVSSTAGTIRSKACR
jgi:hypothetical protein